MEKGCRRLSGRAPRIGRASALLAILCVLATTVSAVVSADEDAGGHDAIAKDALAAIRARMGPPIDEGLYSRVQDLAAALRLADTRMSAAQSETERSRIRQDRKAAFTAADLTNEKYIQISQEIQGIEGGLNAREIAITPAEKAAAEATLQNYDPLSVTTVKSHHTKLVPATTATTDAAEVPPFQKQLTGTWVVDMPASLTILSTGLPPPQAQAQNTRLHQTAHITRITFVFKDHTCSGYLLGTDGSEGTWSGTWKLDGQVLEIELTQGELPVKTLDICMRGEWLMLGKDPLKYAYKKLPK